MRIDYAALDALAQKYMARRKAHPMREVGFIYRHGQRVAKAVIALRARIFPADAGWDDALRVAALFHDIGKGIEPHNVSGAALVRELLAETLPEPFLRDVARLIDAHTRHDSARERDETLLMDADILDHFGAMEVTLSAQYGAYSEEGIAAMLAWYRDEYPAYCVRTRTRLHHPLTQSIFDEKVAYALTFAERLAVEAGGGYVGG